MLFLCHVSGLEPILDIAQSIFCSNLWKLLHFPYEGETSKGEPNYGAIQKSLAS